MKQLPEGKGLYVWNIVDMPDMWIDKFVAMGITWIAVKVADGVNSSNLRKMTGGGTVDDILEPFIKAAKSVGMKVLGWQYVYGFNPDSEADKAAQRVRKFELDGFIIDAEHQYKGKHAQAKLYSKNLRMLLPDTPIGLSTYRFPNGHPRIPYKEFLDICDFNAPQVYWNKGKAGEELKESYRQYELIKSLPFIPAGRSYYGEGFPKPTPAETTEFLTVARGLNCPAAFFWSADRLWHRTQPLPEIVNAIGAYKWAVEDDEPEPEPVDMPENIPSGNYLPNEFTLPPFELHVGDVVYEQAETITFTKKE